MTVRFASLKVATLGDLSSLLNGDKHAGSTLITDFIEVKNSALQYIYLAGMLYIYKVLSTNIFSVFC